MRFDLIAIDTEEAAQDLLKRIAKDGVGDWPVYAETDDEGKNDAAMPSIEVAGVAIRVWLDKVVDNIRSDLFDCIYEGGDPTWGAQDRFENVFHLFAATADDTRMLDADDIGAIRIWLEMVLDKETWYFVTLHSTWLRHCGQIYEWPDGRRFELRTRGDFAKMRAALAKKAGNG